MDPWPRQLAEMVLAVRQSAAYRGSLLVLSLAWAVLWLRDETPAPMLLVVWPVLQVQWLAFWAEWEVEPVKRSVTPPSSIRAFFLGMAALSLIFWLMLLYGAVT